MSQLFGYLCSDQSLTAAVMEQYGAPMQADPQRERTALGIGWLQDGRSLLRKHPRRRAATIEIPDLLSDVPTRALVGHVRHRDQGKADPRSLQPFRFRTWVFAQRGDLPLVEEDLRELRGSIPDHIARNIQGTSTAELIFHLVYAAVEGEYSTTPEHRFTELYVEKLREVVDKVEWRLKDRQSTSWQLIAVTERFLAALSIGESLSYRMVEGIEIATEKPLFAGHRPKRINHDKFRALMVSSGVDHEEWKTTPERGVLWVDGSWEPQVSEL